jgi:HEAT repeat protein
LKLESVNLKILHHMNSAKGPGTRTETYMNVVMLPVRRAFMGQRLILLLALVGVVCGTTIAQDNSGKSAKDSDKKGQESPAAKNSDSEIVGDTDQPAPKLPAAATAAERSRVAWSMLSDAATDSKHPQTQIQALAALGLLRTPRSEKMIREAMKDPDVDVRTAGVLAAGQTKDRNLTTSIRELLDDKEPQVVYTAAMTLWKMGDRSGEDVLMSIVDGDTSARAGMMHGTEHKINRDLHDPAKLAKLGAIQGAYFLLGPFGYGITAFQFIHQSGSDLSRVSAIEELSQEKIEPVHKELIEALGDKDVGVRAAAAKALMDYHDNATSQAVYALLTDNKQPVRLTAAAAYLRTTGTPGPPPIKSPFPPERHAGKVQLPRPGSTARVP